MGDLDERCNPGLFLGLGLGGPVVRHDADAPLQKSPRKAPGDDCDNENSNTPSYGSCSPLRDDYGHPNKRYDGGKEGCCTKKLRLSKEQTTLLEESFNLHNTLTPAQKQSLAHRLKLKPRQVEVWFQNRRARSKLKQMEVDRAFLKKCCDSLREENRGLKKELEDLRSMRDDWKQHHSCPSCWER